jgi:hypothetical protein
LALKRLIETKNPFFILLQEIMTNGEKITQELIKLLGCWDFIFIDAIGRSRENIMGGRRLFYPY